MKSDLESKCPQENPWRRKGSIRIVAFIDMVFGIALVVLYTNKIIFLEPCPDQCSGWSCAPEKQRLLAGGTYMKIVTVLSLMVLIAVNCIQINYAAKMFACVSKTKTEAPRCIRKCKGWLIVTKPIFVLFCIKFIFSILFLLISLDTKNLFLVTFIALTICEWLFKWYAFFSVNSFIKDLEVETSKNTHSTATNCYSLSEGVINPHFDIKSEI